MRYEVVCGLEVHVELATRSKLFCGCSTAFGGEPNTQVCPVCAGLPGALPALNKKAVEFALRAGVALGCAIDGESRFDRKHYVYPDLPKAHQVTQIHRPIGWDGGLAIRGEGFCKTIGIRELHLEEDTGKLLHHPEENRTFVDYNRSGVPLLEIVSRPDLRSADEAAAYLEALREILLFLGVSDCKMQQGSLRVDVNLSVRPSGAEERGVPTEMKNLNSFRAVRRAVEQEAARQIWLLESGAAVVAETRRWEDDKNRSAAMRAKGGAGDYRSLPEPNLGPVAVDADWIRRVRETLPELPAAKRARYKEEYGLSADAARTLTGARELAALFEEAVDAGGEPGETANLIQGDLLRLMGETATLPEDLTLFPAALADLGRLILDGTINRSTGQAVLERMFLDGVDPVRYVEEQGLAMVRDSAAVEQAVERVLAENPRSVADYRGGKEKALLFLVGRTMKALGGKADPKLVNRLLREKL